jgi:MFS family permease
MPRSTPPDSPLRLPGFRRVWAGATLSSAGDAATWIALVSLALGHAHASLPLLAVLYTAPVAVGGLVSGWALDRLDRRKLLLVFLPSRAVRLGLVPPAMDGWWRPRRPGS